MMIASLFNAVHTRAPLVDCITNIVTVESMANALLAVGASPVMADVADEIEAFVNISDALLLNVGAMTEAARHAMLQGGLHANRRNCPIVMDPVGVGASPLRNAVCETLTTHLRFSVIRGNISEMRALAGEEGRTRGVDAAQDDALAVGDALLLARRLAARHRCVIAVSGATDVIASEAGAYAVHNGHPMLTRITGAGCISGALIAAFVGASPERPLEATLAAVALMGLAGEQAAAEARGSGSFHMGLLDALSTLTPDDLAKGARYESL